MSSSSPCCLGLQARAEGDGEADESLAVPLLEENRPPVLPGREKDELADVELRPESVSVLVVYSYSKCMMKIVHAIFLTSLPTSELPLPEPSTALIIFEPQFFHRPPPYGPGMLSTASTPPLLLLRP